MDFPVGSVDKHGRPDRAGRAAAGRPVYRQPVCGCQGRPSFFYSSEEKKKMFCARALQSVSETRVKKK